MNSLIIDFDETLHPMLMRFGLVSKSWSLENWWSCLEFRMGVQNYFCLM